MRQEPRLQFTKEERADPVLEKPIRKADRAADKAEKARAAAPGRLPSTTWKIRPLLQGTWSQSLCIWGLTASCTTISISSI